jgi:hypothetical protein
MIAFVWDWLVGNVAWIGGLLAALGGAVFALRRDAKKDLLNEQKVKDHEQADDVRRRVTAARERMRNNPDRDVGYRDD